MLTTYHWSTLEPTERHRLLRRPSVATRQRVEAVTHRILERVRRDGDQALREVTREVDGVELERFRVDEAEIRRATRDCSPALLEAIADARDNVAVFHRAQLRDDVRVETVEGVICECLVRPLESVGLYVPGGGAPLLSSLIMLGVPAALARCPRRALCTPPSSSGPPEPEVLAAAQLCGIDEIYALGGAQAIGALAYGTASVPGVAKIFGPGNAYVTAAKAIVTRDPEAADCDLIAGPSELVVIADRTADPELVAADLLAQAEHGSDSHVLLICDQPDLATAVGDQITVQMGALPRAKIARRSLEASASIVVEGLETAFEVVNAYAPEHLSLHLEAPRAWLDRVRNAGSVFVGGWTPEVLGDYASGTNHVLPTGGLARTRGGLGVADFQKTMTVQEASPEGLRALGEVATRLAAAESLEGHRRSVALRLERLGEDAA